MLSSQLRSIAIPAEGRVLRFYGQPLTLPASMHSLVKLFGSPARLKTLRLFVFNRGSAFTLGEIAQRTKLSKVAARRELTELVASGLVRKKGRGASASYQTNPRFEHLEALD